MRGSSLLSLRQRARPDGESWLVLFVMFRALAVALSVTVLALHQLTEFDALLGWAVVVYGAVSVGCALRLPALFRLHAVWILDAAIGLGLMLASGDWRSPFYLVALTALAPAAASLPFRSALAHGAGFTAAYFGVALLTGLDLMAARTTVGLEILATHLTLPIIVTLGLASAGQVLRRLEAEQARAHQLALETERRRIAWELHDSAKQRLHAAHLVLSSLPPSEPLELALEQLQAAAGDMETSIAELRSPLEGRPLHDALRRRAAELAPLGSGVEVAVIGEAPPLPTVTANHAYRILAEALTNAVRHAGPCRVTVELGAAPDGGLHAAVSDDGRGLPSSIRPGANGVRTMRSRAFAIGGRLSIGSGDEPGTRVRLDVPSPHDQGVPA